jgi:hypothetical protein
MKRLLFVGLLWLVSGDGRADECWLIGANGYLYENVTRPWLSSRTNQFLYQNVTVPLVKRVESLEIEVVISSCELDLPRFRVLGPSITVRGGLKK